MGKEEKSKIQLLKMHNHPSVPDREQEPCPEQSELKAQKRYDTKEIVEINFVHMKHGGSR